MVQLTCTMIRLINTSASVIDINLWMMQPKALRVDDASCMTVHFLADAILSTMEEEDEDGFSSSDYLAVI